MLRTRLCDLLRIELPIISAPMGPDLSGPDLVAAACADYGLVLAGGPLAVDEVATPVLRDRLRRARNWRQAPVISRKLPGMAICATGNMPDTIDRIHG
jgi:NAD(P)H-dependent flavin oxidoreductase YrpB (nitropropane dioxygenase family)